MSYRAILFDLFDTLIYMRPTRAWEEGIRLAGEAGLSRDQWLAGWRSTLERTLRGEIRSLEERVRQGLIAAGLATPPDSLVRAVLAARECDMLDAPCLYRDVKAHLGHLRHQGFKLGLVSNIMPYETPMVDRLGLRDLVDAVVLSCEVGVCKPDPAIYLAAAERLSVPPEACLFVGDGMSRELSGARAVGMTAVRIERSQRDEDEDRDEVYDARVATLAELAAWLAAQQSADGSGTAL